MLLCWFTRFHEHLALSLGTYLLNQHLAASLIVLSALFFLQCGRDSGWHNAYPCAGLSDNGGRVRWVIGYDQIAIT